MSSELPELWSDDAQRRFLRRNYLALVLDGGFYSAAMAFVAAETVLPSLLKDLGGPNWLVAMAPTLGIYGFFLMPLFTAHWVERLPRFLGFVAWMSVPQRLPPLFAGLALLFLAEGHPVLVLWIVAVSTAAVGFLGGANVTGFWELVAKTIPAHRRSSNLAVRSMVGTAFGLGAGGVIAAVLARWPGAGGYGMLYLLCFGFLLMSLGSLCRVRELPHVPPTRAERSGWRAKLRMLPQWLREDVVMRRFVIARVCGVGIGVLTPFLAIHARDVLHESSSFLGRLVSAQMAGAIAGNLLAAWMGDRWGGRIVAQLGGLAGIALCLGALVNRSGIGFLAMFFALGMTTFLSFNGAMTLLLELFPGERRPTYVALTSLAIVPALLAAAVAAAWLRSASDAIWPAALVAAVLLLTSQVFFHLLPEPRKRQPGA